MDEGIPLVEFPPPAGSGLNLGELWQFRDLIVTLAGRDIKLRYKQTALGPWWVLFQPLLSAGTFSFVFGSVAGLSSGGLPYFVVTYTGMMGWNLFNSALTRSSGSVVADSHLVSKVYFPRLVMPLAAVLSALLDLLVAAVPLLGCWIWYRMFPGYALLALPLWILWILMLGTGIGLFLAAYMVRYRDVAYVTGVFTQILMLASPVAYTLAAVPARYHHFYLLNPLAPLLEGFRWSCLGTAAPASGFLLYGALAAPAVLAAGLLTFRSMEDDFADVI